VVKKKSERNTPVPPTIEGGRDRSCSGMDSEEIKIFRQSIPAEEISRDFLQELLDEHRATRKPGSS
jgi:hypothetical protein